MPGDGWSRPTPLVRAAVALLAAANGALLLRALAIGRLEVTDGSTIALGIGLTLAAALAISWLPLPAGPLARTQSVILAAQLFHALGHLERLYHRVPNYDDLFHVATGVATALVLYDLSRSRRFLFTTRLGAGRVATLTAVASVALAGVWELFEWTSDNLLGTREQDDLHDTMQDMADGLVGAAGAALLVWRVERTRARKIAQETAAAPR